MLETLPRRTGNPYQAETDWHGCYRGDTSKDGFLFTVESVRHPAKMSNPLLDRIIRTMQEFGWLKRGDCLVDPFGGTGRTALWWCAQHPENRAATIEIEAHFVQMQQDNKRHAERKLGRPLPWTILRGDSRKADELLRDAGVGITSPPYENTPLTGERNFKSRHASKQSRPEGRSNPREGYAGISSPPYEQAIHSGNGIDPAKLTGNKAGKNSQWQHEGYEHAGVTSPPYEAQRSEPNYSEERKAKMSGPCADRRDAHRAHEFSGYSASVTSPPYEAQSGGHPVAAEGPLSDPKLHDRHAASKINAQTGYADNEEGQIGTTEGNRGWPLGSREYAPPWPYPYPVYAKQNNGVCVSFGGDNPCLDPSALAPIAEPYAGPGAAGLATAHPPTSFRSPTNGSVNQVSGSGERPILPLLESGTDTGRAGTNVGAGLGIKQSTEPQKSGTTTPVSSADEVAVALPPITKSRGGKAGKPRSKTSPLSATHAITGPTNPTESPNPLPASSAEQGTKASDETASAHRPAEPNGTPQGTTAGSPKSAAQPPEDYASACLQVYSACARAGIRYLAIVTKDPTRNGKLRRIGKLTCRLLRASGYRVVAWRRAWLFETEAQLEQRGAHTPTLFEGLGTPGRVVGRISFFKRLHLAKGRIAAQHEDVFFAVLDSGEGVSVMSPPYGQTEIMHVGHSIGDAWAEKGQPAISGELGDKRMRRYGFTDGQIGQLRDPEETPTTRLYSRWWTLDRLKSERDLTAEEQTERRVLAAKIDFARGVR